MANPPNIRKAIYTTNAIESMNMGLESVPKLKTITPIPEILIKSNGFGTDS
ncbi:hypothetical protein LEP1GSC125_1318 [Leptospira mayottensis 200901122]|uniref:Transposase n=1 Tax=Leptospira mayottensis 200901122 TaxID=1193010 RepID=A0AA87SUR5_9LEPT|nr:hypothetical protein LEP1GSC125_1318 [Leptospira mayottensis 200901122]